MASSRAVALWIPAAQSSQSGIRVGNVSPRAELVNVGSRPLADLR